MFHLTQTLLAVFFLFPNFYALGQDLPEEAPQEKPIENYKPQFTINIDTSVFNKSYGEGFASDKYPMASILIDVMSNVEMQEDIFKIKPGEKEIWGTDSEVERFQVNGRDYLKIVGPVKNDHSRILIMYTVFDEPNSYLIMTNYCLKQDSAVLMPIFDRAAQSLRLRR